MSLAAEIDPACRFVETSAQDAGIVGDLALTHGRWGAYDTSRLFADTGWRPRPLAAALRDYADWLSAHTHY